MRVLAFFTMQPHVKKGTLRQPKDLFALSWEESAAARSGPRALSERDLAIIARWEAEEKRTPDGKK